MILKDTLKTKLKTIGLFFLVLAFSGFFNSLEAQMRGGMYDRLLLSYSDWALVEAIDEMNQRKAAVSYNIANASSPGFKPVRFQDEIDAVRSLYGDDSMLNQVQVDDEMIKATQVRLKHSAYVRLLTTKMQITKRIVTLNKGG